MIEQLFVRVSSVVFVYVAGDKGEAISACSDCSQYRRAVTVRGGA